MKISRVIARSPQTASNTEMQREKPDTYTHCKLKKEKQKKGRNTENKGGQDIRNTCGGKLACD